MPAGGSRRPRFVRGQKNDYNDVQAIAEVALRFTVRVVRVKTMEQQDIQMLRHMRSRLAQQRTALINQARAMLLEPRTTANHCWGQVLPIAT